MSADVRAAEIGSNVGVVRFSNSSAVPRSYPKARGGIRSMMRCGICRNDGSSVDITALIASRCRGHDRAMLFHGVGVIDAADRFRRRLELIETVQIQRKELLFQRRERLA